MNKPTCATCAYYRPYGEKDGSCTVLRDMGYYCHMYAKDTACNDYRPKEPQTEKRNEEQ